MVLDTSGAAIVTGTSKTLKLGTGGDLLWTAPYGGRAVAAAGTNVYVTGFSEVDFATARLSGLDGTNLWVRYHDYHGDIGISQAVAGDAVGNTCVGGFEEWWCYRPPLCYKRGVVIAYAPEGNGVWTNYDNGNPFNNNLIYEVRSLCTDAVGNVWLMGHGGSGAGYITTKFDPGGTWLWRYALPGGGWAAAMVLDPSGNAYVTGNTWGGICTTVKVSSSGQQVWRADYSGPQGSAKGIAIALDSAGNVYITGYSPTTATGQDIFTIKFDHNGNQVWVRRYNGPANGNDLATGLVVDSTGNVYVTGYSATASGGTEFVTIKYAPVSTIKRQPSGSMLLQFPGFPGQSCGLEATTNFLSWATLGLVPADTNGLFQFEDTNATLYPARFYRWHYP